MQGNEACAEGAIAAGVRFFGGYPITPSTEIAEGMAKMLPAVGGKFVQMEDEIASMGVVLGASLAGKKALTASSGPGISLKQELIGYAACAEIPVVVVSGFANGAQDYAHVMRHNGVLVEKKENFTDVVGAVLDRLLATC